MPIYEYVCSSCDHRADILHGINEAGPKFCPSCGREGTMRKQFAPPTIHFKGSGWAKKDRGGSAGTRASRSSSGEPGSSSESSSSDPSSSESSSSSSERSSSERSSSSSSDRSSSGSSSSERSSSERSSSGESSSSSASDAPKPTSND